MSLTITVICEPGPQADEWELPAASFVPRAWIGGGTRTLYEAAAALAAAGHSVELRGSLCPDALHEITTAAGVTIATPTSPRRPRADELVILPEGWHTPLHYARLVLSSARVVVVLLSPPGCCGWPFVDGWSPPDLLELDVADVARSEHFRAMEALGLTLWTNAPATRDAALAAGVDCTFIGRGQPLPWPEPMARTHDVGLICDNRWAPLARTVIDELDDASVLVIEGGSRASVLAQLARVRILPWPSRIEGHSRIQCEARAMGVVPVALPNPFADGLRSGGIVVESIEAMAPKVRELLADDDRLQQLSRTALVAARGDEEWLPYVARVDAAARVAARSTRGPAAEALAVFGEDIHQRLVGAGPQPHARVAELEYHALHMSGIVAQLELEAREARAELLEAREAHGRLQLDLRSAHGQLDDAMARLADDDARAERERDVQRRTEQALAEMVTAMRSSRGWRLLERGRRVRRQLARR